MEKEDEDNLIGLLLNAGTAARLLGIGRSLFYQMSSFLVDAKEAGGW